MCNLGDNLNLIQFLPDLSYSMLSIFESSPYFIFLFNEAGKLLYINKALSELTSIPMELTDKITIDHAFFSKNDADIIVKSLTKLNDPISENSCSFDFKNSVVHDIYTNWTFLKCNEARKTFIGLGRNVTDEKNIELYLSKSTNEYLENFRELFDICDKFDGHAILFENESNKILYVNDYLVVRHNENYINLNFHLDLVKNYFFEVKKSESSLQSSQWELKTIEPNRYYQYMEKIFKRSDNSKIHFIATKDITTYINTINKLKQTQNNFNNDNEILNDVLSSVGAGLACINKDFRINWVNQKFQEMMHDEKLVGNSWLKLFKKQNSELENIFIFKTFVSGEISEELLTFNDDRYYRVISYPVKNRADEINEVLNIIFDITEQKITEREKISLQNQLYQSQKLKTLGNLASGIVHDFNNLMTGIVGSISMIKHDIIESDKNYKLMFTIERAALQAAKLSRQILNFSHIDQYEKIPIDVNEAVNNISKLLRLSLNKSVIINLDLAPNLKYILADIGQIELLLLNLAMNAHDAMPNGGNLNIKTENIIYEENSEDNYIQNEHFQNAIKITVSDTGNGISQKHIDKIFNPFFTTKPRQRGTGLGLSTVQNIVKSYEGEIFVETELNKGTTFTLIFPITRIKTVTNQEIDNNKICGGSETILIVDDEDILRDMTSIILSRIGYKTLAVANGFEACEAMKNYPEQIDLILLDLFMPKMDGFTTFHFIRKINNDVKILLMSGSNTSNRIDELLKKGAQGFIQKPFDVPHLTTLIRKTLKYESIPKSL